MPAFFIHTRALPLLNNRKLDRRSATAELRAALSAQPPACAKEPTSETETTVLRMWRQLLNADDIGADSNFFGVGGHSLAAMQFLNRVQAAFNVEIHIGDFLSNPTVSAVAAAIDAADSLVPA